MRGRKVQDFVQDPFPNGGIGDDARAPVGLLLACLKLRFDQGNEASTRLEVGPYHGEDEAERDEGKVHHDERVSGVWQVAGLEVPGIDPFTVDNARIGAQLVMQLTMADIDAGGFPGACLQEVICKAPGGGPDVEEALALNRPGPLRKESCQLVRAARDVARSAFDR